jgi:hypothetical protein
MYVDGTKTDAFLLQGFFWSYYDSITGLVVEPMRGAKEEVCMSRLTAFLLTLFQGAVGVVKGAVRSCKTKAMAVDCLLTCFRFQSRDAACGWYVSCPSYNRSL